MIRKILLGYDGSASAERAARFAVDLAQRYNAELHVLTVARPPDFGDEVETEAAIENAQRQNDKLLAKARMQLAQAALAMRFHAAVGHPAEQIVRFAEAHAIDHIVVGHRGHSLFERWLLGSVARRVIAYANCSVTVVRGQAKP
jgi:nucleotide-binding universal stress UspA family protein